jgi:hypothetical protein
MRHGTQYMYNTENSRKVVEKKTTRKDELGVSTLYSAQTELKFGRLRDRLVQNPRMHRASWGH